jgi:cyclin-dependent kinase 10
LLPGKDELSQLHLIVELLGRPSDDIWPGLSELPLYRTFALPNQPYENLKEKFPYVSSNGLGLLKGLFTYDPTKRMSARAARSHPYWHESPLPTEPSCMPSFPEIRDGRLVGGGGGGR